MKKKCIICGQEFSKEGRWKTCSTDCSRRLRNQRNKKWCKANYWCSEKYHELSNQRNEKRKLLRVLALGGKCQKCGYCKNLAALEFAHKKKLNKDWNKRRMEECPRNACFNVEKTLLLCVNCHREKDKPNQEINQLKAKYKLNS
jgi:hypothetical protein